MRSILLGTRLDVTVIRSWLGHVSLDTTNHYARANLETKRKALEQLGVPETPSLPPSRKRDTSVLAWLDLL
jgi:integrase